jgi:hypothetical protein
MSRLDPISHAFNLSLTPILQRLFGADIVEKARLAGIKKPRDIFELTSANGQCNAIIGGLESGTRCWICGLGIQMKTKGFAIKSKGPATDVKSGVTAECEHVLPVAQASILLNLYNPTMKGTSDAFLKKSLELEYGWAHVVCNQEKGTICPILVKRNGTFEVSREQVKNLLEKIKSSTRSDSNLLKFLIRAWEKKTGNEFVKTRLPIVMERYNKIVEFISRVDDPTAAKLIVFAGIATLTDKDKINPKLHEAIDAIKDIKLGSIAPIYTKEHSINSEYVIDTYNDIRMRIKDAIGANPEMIVIWKELTEEFKKFTKYLSGTVDNESEENYSSNLFKFLIHLNTTYPEAITKDNNRIAIALFIYIKMLKEMLEHMEVNGFQYDKITFMSDMIDNYETMIDSSMYKRLDEDYRAYETAEIHYAADVLAGLKSMYQPRIQSRFKTLKSKKLSKIAKKFTMKRKSKGVSIVENEPEERIKHTTRSGRTATRLKGLKF